MTPLIIAYILNIIDYLFTSHWVNLYGLSAEGNPLGRWMFENGFAGVFKIFIVGGLFVTLGYFINRYPKYKRTGCIPILVYGSIVLYHTGLMVYISII